MTIDGRGVLLMQEPLAKYCTWRVGGPADRLYRPRNRGDLSEFLQSLPAAETVYWLGLGSNVLIRDGGLRGTVICTKNRFKELRLEAPGLVYAEAGVPCPLLARFCADQGLSGAEFLAGIPGTLGGALAMNAGAFGGETWTLIERVDTVDRLGRFSQRQPRDFQIGYRSVKKPGQEWFLAALLRLRPGAAADSHAAIRAMLAKRAQTQPTNQASCGSVFKNPAGDHAARLIEQSGLKGFVVGGAQVSEKHANFIINRGRASAAHIETLIGHVREEIRARHGVRLQTEVCIIGETING